VLTLSGESYLVLSMNHPKLELDSLTVATEREWLIQRLGWIVWTGVIVAALVGFMGRGPYSDSIATSSDRTTEVSFNKYVHYHSPETLEITLRPESDTETARLFLSRSLLDNMEIRRTEPEATKSILAQDGVFYDFAKQPLVDSIKIVMHVDYQKFGNISGEIGLAEHPAAALNQFVYP
jgi:hypothetical protein